MPPRLLEDGFYCPIRRGGRTPLGKTATRVVAASDADPVIKLFADHVCTGTDAEVQIEAAHAALPTAGGTILSLIHI